MDKIAEIGNVEIYRMDNTKFKTSLIKVVFLDVLSKENAYKNSLLPNILRGATEKYSSKNEIELRLMELYGAEIFTSLIKFGDMQEISFSMELNEEKYLKTDEKIFEQCVSLLFDIIYKPYLENGCFSKRIFERERENHNDQIDSLFNNKVGYTIDRLIEKSFEGQPYALDVWGAKEDGEKLDEKILYDYYRNYFLKKLKVRIYCHTSENCGIIKKIIEENGYYSEEETNKIFNEMKPYSKREEPLYVENTFSGSQSNLDLLFKTDIDPDSEESAALKLACSVLGEGSASMLFKNVREKNSLAYFAASQVVRTKSFLMIYCGIAAEKKEKALEVILKQVDDLKKGKFKAEDLKIAKKNIVDSVKSMSDSQYSQLDYHKNETYRKNPLTPEEYIKKIEGISQKQVAEAASRLELDCIYFMKAIKED